MVSHWCWDHDGQVRLLRDKPHLRTSLQGACPIQSSSHSLPVWVALRVSHRSHFPGPFRLHLVWRSWPRGCWRWHLLSPGAACLTVAALGPWAACGDDVDSPGSLHFSASWSVTSWWLFYNGLSWWLLSICVGGALQNQSLLSSQSSLLSFPEDPCATKITASGQIRTVLGVGGSSCKSFLICSLPFSFTTNHPCMSEFLFQEVHFMLSELLQ